MNALRDTVGDLLIAAEQALRAIDGARRDAELLLERVMNTERAWLYAHPEALVTPALACDFRLLVDRRREGFPLAYLMGEKEFWSMPFMVNRHTLIPRPETEHLVETALGLIRDAGPVDILDLGTGCGAIAMVVAAERPDCRMTATDISREALAVAQENARRLGFQEIEFHRTDWLSGLGARRFGLILSNPPYIDSGDPALLDTDIRFEPRIALDGGHGGLHAIRLIIAAAVRHLTDAGSLVLEHGWDQGEHVRGLLRLYGFRDIATRTDHAGLERVSWARRP